MRIRILLYDLVTMVIDTEFPVLEVSGDRIEAFEEKLVGPVSTETLGKLHGLRRDLLALRRMIWPHREVVNFPLREEFPLIQASTKLYLRDCYDTACILSSCWRLTATNVQHAGRLFICPG